MLCVVVVVRLGMVVLVPGLEGGGGSGAVVCTRYYIPPPSSRRSTTTTTLLVLVVGCDGVRKSCLLHAALSAAGQQYFVLLAPRTIITKLRSLDEMIDNIGTRHHRYSTTTANTTTLLVLVLVVGCDGGVRKSCLLHAALSAAGQQYFVCSHRAPSPN